MFKHVLLKWLLVDCQIKFCVEDISKYSEDIIFFTIQNFNPALTFLYGKIKMAI